MGHNRAGDHVRVIKRRRRKEQARLARKAEAAVAPASSSEGVLSRAKHVAEAAAHKVGDAAKVAAGAVKHAIEAVTHHDKPQEGKPG